MKSKPDVSSWCLPGHRCWCETMLPQIFYPALIKSLDEALNKVTVEYSPDLQSLNLPYTLDIGLISELNEQPPPDPLLYYEDMVVMDCLNEAELLNNLRLRYFQNLIFTYIGPTLLIINPYKPLNHLFEEKTLIPYQQQAKMEVFELKMTPPHVFSIAAKAYHQLFMNIRNQAIVISGESGAGKTENTKYAMKFLTSLSSSSEESKASTEIPIEDRILGCNPILEAFGNAKTVRNDNSSRFGKYVRILVQKSNHKIIGAGISNYLLEKSRVVSQSPGERNYHIFYQLFTLKKLKNIEFIENLKISNKNIEDFEYLKRSHGVQHGINDEDFFQEVLNSFEKMKFLSLEKEAVFRLLSGILYLGNIDFDENTYSDNTPCSIVNKEVLSVSCEILGIEEKVLEKALVFKTREIGKQLIESPVNKEECGFLRDSLSKGLYEKLFNWLVKRLNLSILPLDELKATRSIRKSIKEMRKSVLLKETTFRLSIGLLDIFGFENFLTNSFEQLCINFTNEKLQQLYIAYVFKSEEAEFIEQGLKDQLYRLSYEDNQPIIDLIDKYPLGIFDLLEESCSLGSGTDDALLQKFSKTYKENTKFTMPKLNKDRFILIHTAKNVEYTITGFRNKNKDLMTKELESAILNSCYKEVKEIYEGKIEQIIEQVNPEKAVANKKGEKTLAGKFRVQMKDLMQELMSCDVSFIRCIKPNEVKQADNFLCDYVLQQIKYLGVLESIRIRKEGFPYRKEYKLFLETYGNLKQGFSLKKDKKDIKDHRERSEKLLMEIFNKEEEKGFTNKALYGKTKVYLKQDLAGILDKKLMELYKLKKLRAKQILLQYRLYRKRIIILKKLHILHKKIMKFIRIQAYARRKDCRRRFLLKKQAISRLNRWIRKSMMKRCLRRLLEKVIMYRKWTAKKQAAVKHFNLIKRYYRKIYFKFLLQKTKEKAAYLHQKHMEALEFERKRIEEEQLEKEKEQRYKAELEEKSKKEAERIKKEADEKARKETEKALQQAAAKASLNKSPSKQSKNHEEVKEFPEEVKETTSPSLIIDPISSPIKEPLLLKKETSKEVIIPKETIINQVEEAKDYLEKPKIIEILTKSQGLIILSSLKTIPASLLITLKNGIPILHSSNNHLSGFLTDYSRKTQVPITHPYSTDIKLNLETLDPTLFKTLTQYTFWEYVEPLVSYKKSWGKSVSVASVMSFSKSAVHIPLLHHGEAKDKEAAVKIFGYIKKFLLTKDLENELLISMKILMEGFYGSPGLRDEVYLQVLKQLNNNPDKYLRLKLYKLFGLIGSAFSVSLRGYCSVLSFLLEAARDDLKLEPEEDLRVHARFAFNRIRRTFESSGKALPPLEHEIKSLWILKTIPIRITFLNNRVLTIYIESWTKVKNALIYIENEVKTHGLSRYIGLYIREPLTDDRSLDDDMVLMDELTQLEFRRMANPTKDYRLLVKQRLFSPNYSQEKDILNLLYIQSIDEFLRGTFPCQLDDIVYLAAINLFVDKEGSSYDKIFNLESAGDNLEIGVDIEKYVPKGSISKEVTKQYLLVKVLNRYLNNKDMKELDSSKLDFCNYLRRYDEFLSQRFICKSYLKVTVKKGDIEEISDDEVFFYIKPFIVMIVSKTSKNKQVFHYKEIEGFGVIKDNVFAFRTFDLQIHIIECIKAKEIERVMQGYLQLLKVDN